MYGDFEDLEKDSDEDKNEDGAGEDDSDEEDKPIDGALKRWLDPTRYNAATWHLIGF